MNEYEAKQQARKDRYLAKAQSLTEQADTAHDRARTMAESIPFGQPILIGHHSEKRDRNFRNRIHDTYGKAFILQNKAAYYESKADSVGTGGISSDDPDAITKLKKQLSDVRASQEAMKKANALIRKHKSDDAAQIAAIAALDGFNEDLARELLKPDFCGRIGFPSYTLSNNNANAKRIEKRIKELERIQERASVELEGEGYTYREDIDENRVMFIFPGKPDEKIRALLKRYAFKWSPSRSAWIRQLNNASIWNAKQVMAALDTTPSA